MHTLLAQRRNSTQAHLLARSDILYGAIAIARAKAERHATMKRDPREAARSSKLFLGSMAMFLISLGFFLFSR